MAGHQGAEQNHLLAALPAAELERLVPHLELSSLRLGDVLCEAGEVLEYAYFPATSIVSLRYLMESGACVEVAGVGNEGMLGIPLFMGGQNMPHHATVQTAGAAYRLKAKVLIAEFQRAESLQRSLLRYAQALFTQSAQNAACNSRHSLLQQLCRWLLSTLDRLPSNDLLMTQELIAGMLGVRREGVTEALGKLRDMGVISARRGHITVLHRSLLETQVCECYAVVKSEFERLLGEPDGDCKRKRRGPGT